MSYVEQDIDPFNLPKDDDKGVATVEKNDTGLTITYKAGEGGYKSDCPWIVLHVDSIEEALRLHSIDPKGKGLADLFAVVAKASRKFHELYDESSPTTTAKPQLSPEGKMQNVPAPTAPPASAGDTQTCQHGQREYKFGESAKGPWRAWMCPLPKGDPAQCKPNWIR